MIGNSCNFLLDLKFLILSRRSSEIYYILKNNERCSLCLFSFLFPFYLKSQRIILFFFLLFIASECKSLNNLWFGILHPQITLEQNRQCRLICICICMGSRSCFIICKRLGVSIDIKTKFRVPIVFVHSRLKATLIIFFIWRLD